MEIEAQELHHYGLIAATCKEIGLVKMIDDLTNSSSQRKVSVGECIVAMILNGTGYTSRPLYLTSQFFINKPLDKLIRDGIEHQDLNDDALGRALDALYINDCTKIFTHIALAAAKQYGVDRKVGHFDATNMQVWGEYDSKGDKEEFIKFGFAKQDRIDLKQFLISIMVSSDGSIPLFAQTLPGNESEKKHYQDTLSKISKNIDVEGLFEYYCIDAAYFSEEIANIDVMWITRVPENISGVLTNKESCLDKTTMTLYNDAESGYSFREFETSYRGHPQRWIVVFSKSKKDKAIETIKRAVSKELISAKQLQKKLQHSQYSCEEDAIKAVRELNEKLVYHSLIVISIETVRHFSKKGRPADNSESALSYKLKLKIEHDTEKTKNTIELKSMFVLATNQLDKSKLPSAEVLRLYKEQYKVERGFRFLKDPMCATSSVFLKNQKRIAALGMVMVLCLLIYSLTERKLRKALEKNGDTLPNQVGKKIKNPTLKWITQLFEGVIIAKVQTGAQRVTRIVNLTQVLKKIIRYLGLETVRLYLPDEVIGYNYSGVG